MKVKVKGVLLGENELVGIMKDKYKRRVTRIETQQDSFKVSFDPSEDINAIILGPEDMARVMKDYFGRNAIDVRSLEHEEYLVRFSD